MKNYNFRTFLFESPYFLTKMCSFMMEKLNYLLKILIMYVAITILLEITRNPIFWRSGQEGKV